MRAIKPSLTKCLLMIGGCALVIGLGERLILVDKPITHLFDKLSSTTPDITGQTADRATIEDDARIKLPLQVTNIQAHTECGIDRLILLKFTLSTAAIPDLATSGY